VNSAVGAGTTKTVLVVHSTSDLYGASRVLLMSVTAMTAAGIRPIVVVSGEGPLTEELRRRGVQVEILSLAVIRRKYMNLRGMLGRTRRFLVAWHRLARLVDEHDVGLIYTNTAAVWVGAWVARRKGIRHLWHIHEIVVEPSWFRAVLHGYVRRTADMVVCVSRAVLDHLRGSVPEERLHLLYNGIDPTPFVEAAHDLRAELGLHPQSVVIGMVGRVHPWKGQTYLLDTARHLVPRHENLQFILAGDVFPGNEYLHDELNVTVREHGLAGHVSFLGQRDDIPLVLSGIDIFLLPSVLPDPLPTTVLEAMASGLPVVATAHGGACEMVVHGETGYLVPWDDAAAVASALEALIQAPELRERLGRAGRERVREEFSQEAFLVGMSTLILSAMEAS
jgi:glycosyltransferase involved in cell wall biosynthesis